MFFLALLEDIVRLKPHCFGRPLDEELRSRLNEKYADKVVPEVGLALFVHDLLEIGASFILPGDGCSHTHVKFRLVAFKPFIDEIVEATIASNTREGLYLSLIFFEDIFIPVERFPQTCTFEEETKVWYWDYRSEDNEAPVKLYMDPGKSVRFRVVRYEFRDVDPSDETDDTRSFQIMGSIAESGLGCTIWWTFDEEDGDGEEQEGTDDGVDQDE